ncbi:MAG: SMI1/KNR4 family protein [Rhizobacter sp.]|nr:SMI1/KNR4 family protein [Chlorobiales bacterium]
MTQLPAIDTVLGKWRAEGIKLLPPATEATVVAALDKTGKQYSQDVVALYCATGGMEMNESDHSMWALWSLEQVISENKASNHAHLLFSDYLIFSHLYYFKYESEEKSSIYLDHFVGEPPVIVAASVNEFFELYLKNPEKLEMFLGS